MGLNIEGNELCISVSSSRALTADELIKISELVKETTHETTHDTTHETDQKVEETEADYEMNQKIKDTTVTGFNMRAFDDLEKGSEDSKTPKFGELVSCHLDCPACGNNETVLVEYGDRTVQCGDCYANLKLNSAVYSKFGIADKDGYYYKASVRYKQF